MQKRLYLTSKPASSVRRSEIKHAASDLSTEAV